MSVTITDNFTDTDTTALGSHTISPINTQSAAWTVRNGTTTIVSNRTSFSGTSPGGTPNLASVTLAQSDAVITTIVNATNNGSGILARWTDNNNFIIGRMGQASSIPGLSIYKREAGSYTQLALTSFTPGSGDHTMVFTLSGSSLSATLDGANLTSTTSTLNQTTKNHGIYGDDTSVHFDDFVIEINGLPPLLEGGMLRGGFQVLSGGL